MCAHVRSTVILEKEGPPTNITVSPMEKRLLCSIQEVETWQSENKYLVGHYRIATCSYRASFTSLGYLHNQTSNIYTHVLGAALFLWWAQQTYYEVLVRYPSSNFDDLLAFGVFFACAVMCFGFSACFHLLNHHSQLVNHKWLLLDLYGVFLMIIGTVFSGTFYGFYCERHWWKVYSAGILLVTVSCAVFCTRPRFRHDKWRNVRAILFVSIGFYGCLPMMHLTEYWGGRPDPNARIGWDLMFLEGLCYLGGAVVYAARIPERWRPGAFDIWGASHQIFHVCAVVGAALHYRGLLRGFDYNHSPTSRQC